MPFPSEKGALVLLPAQNTNADAICYIVGAGDLCGPVIVPGADDCVIAADAGLRHIIEIGITPDLLVGDLDSMPKDTVLPPNSKIVSPIKDDTDMMLAIYTGLDRGFRRFRLYGATGGKRFAHTLGNLQAMAFLSQQGAEAIMYEAQSVLYARTNGTVRFPEKYGYLSVFAFGCDAHGVTLSGLKYPMENGTLPAARPLGVSNEFIGQMATVTVQDGTLILILPRESAAVLEHIEQKETHDMTEVPWY